MNVGLIKPLKLTQLAHVQRFISLGKTTQKWQYFERNSHFLPSNVVELTTIHKII